MKVDSQLYLTDLPDTLVKPHVKGQHPDIKIREATGDELHQYLIIPRGVFYIQLTKDKFPSAPLGQAQDNITYLQFEDSIPEKWLEWGRNRKWVKILKIDLSPYRKNLDELLNRKLITQKAADWIWQTYRYSPYRLNIEIFRLLWQLKETRKGITLEAAQGNYYFPESPNLIEDMMSGFGKVEGSRFIWKQSPVNLKSLFIGWNSGSSYKPPLLHRALKYGYSNIYFYLTYLQTAPGDLRINAIIFNEWIRRNGGLRMDFNPCFASIEELEDLLF